MATGQISSTPWFFNFLKEGLLLPRHNPRLFATIFTIMAGFSCLLRLRNDLAAGHPVRDEIGLDTTTAALNTTDPSSPEDMLRQLTQDDTWALLLTREAHKLFRAIIRAPIEIVLHFAAVATYSGELHTFGSLLGKVRKTRLLKGPVLTLAFVHALVVANGALHRAMSRLLARSRVAMLVVVPFPFVYLVYFSYLCPLTVVVAVAEPGCHGAGALRRAWRLVKGKRGRALLFVSVTAVLAFALTSVFIYLPKRPELSMAAGLLLGFLYSTLKSALQLFEACAMVAFYYECKGSTKASAFLPILVKL